MLAVFTHSKQTVGALIYVITRGSGYLHVVTTKIRPNFHHHLFCLVDTFVTAVEEERILMNERLKESP